MEDGDLVVHNPGAWHEGRYGIEQSPCGFMGIFFESPALESLLAEFRQPNLQPSVYCRKLIPQQTFAREVNHVH
jgi:hypothetical protein